MDTIENKVDQSSGQKRLFRSNWRTILEVLTSVVLLAAGGTVLWGAIGRMIPNSAPSRPEIKPPAELQPLDGTHLRGSRDARVGIIVYSDFQCPFCGKFARETFPEIERQYVRSGKVAFGFRHFPLERIHPLAIKAAEAADCAGRQGRFWQMHDALFLEGASLELAGLVKAATTAGLDIDEARACIESDGSQEVRAHLAAAQALQVTSTPIFFVGTIEAGGLRVTDVLRGAQPLASFAAVLDRLLAAGRSE